MKKKSAKKWYFIALYSRTTTDMKNVSFDSKHRILSGPLSDDETFLVDFCLFLKKKASGSHFPDLESTFSTYPTSRGHIDYFLRIWRPIIVDFISRVFSPLSWLGMLQFFVQSWAIIALLVVGSKLTAFKKLTIVMVDIWINMVVTEKSWHVMTIFADAIKAIFLQVDFFLCNDAMSAKPAQNLAYLERLWSR